MATKHEFSLILHNCLPYLPTFQFQKADLIKSILVDNEKLKDMFSRIYPVPEDDNSNLQQAQSTTVDAASSNYNVSTGANFDSASLGSNVISPGFGDKIPCARASKDSNLTVNSSSSITSRYHSTPYSISYNEYKSSIAQTFAAKDQANLKFQYPSQQLQAQLPTNQSPSMQSTLFVGDTLSGASQSIPYLIPGLNRQIPVPSHMGYGEITGSSDSYSLAKSNQNANAYTGASIPKQLTPGQLPPHKYSNVLSSGDKPISEAHAYSNSSFKGAHIPTAASSSISYFAQQPGGNESNHSRFGNVTPSGITHQ